MPRNCGGYGSGAADCGSGAADCGRLARRFPAGDTAVEMHGSEAGYGEVSLWQRDGFSAGARGEPI